jgi:hypothetical protein
MRSVWLLVKLGFLTIFTIGSIVRETSIFLLAMAGVVVLLTLAVEPPSSKTWWGGVITAGVIALLALTLMILSGGIAWRGVNPWGPVLLLGSPAAGFLWVWAQLRESSDHAG